MAYVGLGAYFGNLVSQNGKGYMLGHLKDLGEDATKIDQVRVYRTNARWVSPWDFPTAPIFAFGGGGRMVMRCSFSPHPALSYVFSSILSTRDGFIWIR